MGKKLLTVSDRHLVDYNYVDAAAGVTYLKYWAGATKNAAGTTTYELKPFGFHGTTLYSSSGGSATGERINVTFTYTVKRNIIVDGNALIGFRIFMDEAGGGGSNSTYDLKVELFKDATSLGSFTRTDIGGTHSIGSGNYEENVNAIIDCTRTVFKEDDDLKLEITFTASEGNVVMGLYVFYDPDSATVTVDSVANEHTEMILYLPVVPEM